MGFNKIGLGCCCNPCTSYCFTVLLCSTPTNTPAVGATIVVKSGSTTIDSGTTNSSGVWCSTLLIAGPYTVTISMPSYQDIVLTGFTPTSPCSRTVSFAGTTRAITVPVGGCTVALSCTSGAKTPPLAGAVVTIVANTGPNAGTHYTATSDASGFLTYLLPDVSANYQFTSGSLLPRFAAISTTPSTFAVAFCRVFNGSGSGVFLTPATGYHCYLNLESFPIADILHYTTSLGDVGTVNLATGATTITWSDGSTSTLFTSSSAPACGFGAEYHWISAPVAPSYCIVNCVPTSYADASGTPFVMTATFPVSPPHCLNFATVTYSE